MRCKWKSSAVICSWAPQQCPHVGAREVEKGLSTSDVRQGDRSRSSEEKLKKPLQGNSAVLPLHNHICSGVGNDCTEEDTKEQKEMPGKQKPSDKREAQLMVRETT